MLPHFRQDLNKNAKNFTILGINFGEFLFKNRLENSKKISENGFKLIFFGLNWDPTMGQKSRCHRISVFLIEISKTIKKDLLDDKNNSILGFLEYPKSDTNTHTIGIFLKKLLQRFLSS